MYGCFSIYVFIVLALFKAYVFFMYETINRIAVPRHKSIRKPARATYNICSVRLFQELFPNQR